MTAPFFGFGLTSTLKSYHKAGAFVYPFLHELSLWHQRNFLSRNLVSAHARNARVVGNLYQVKGARPTRPGFRPVQRRHDLDLNRGAPAAKFAAGHVRTNINKTGVFVQSGMRRT